MDICFQKMIFARRFPRLIHAVFIVAVLLYTCGCSSSPKSNLLKMTFIVKSKSEANKGQPFYIVFRSVNVNEFLTQEYQELAGMIFTNPNDPSLLGTHLVTPDEKFEIKVDQPPKNNIGIYGCFTEPGDTWKMMIPQPLEEEYEIILESNGILKVDKPKGIFRKALFFLD